uniref:ORF8b protein n=1 Tax=Middle East respiratory syndrome-related coronavirus TaxID=1335626 RepID=A0A2R2YRH9_MERS|nr:ORF8b protein [Middle East respiratory syndrome-related coronavirus]
MIQQQISLEVEDVIRNPELHPIPLSPGTLGLPNTVKSLFPSHLDRVYLLMPILPLRKMLGIGGDRTERLTQEMELSNWLPDGTSTILEPDLKLHSLSVLSKKALSGSMKMAPLMLLQLLGRGTLTMTQLLLHNSLPVLSFLKTSILRGLEAIVSHLQEPLAQAETLLDPVHEVQDQVTPPVVLPQVHLESELPEETCST